MRKNPDKPFSDSQAEEVEKTFGITRLETLPILAHFKTLHFNTNHPFYNMIKATAKKQSDT